MENQNENVQLLTRIEGDTIYMFTRITKSADETAQLAQMVGKKLHEGTVVCLDGDLGAGKTLFVQNIARMLGVEGEVTSPTFNLMNVYEGICRVYHFDLYRLETAEELEDIGFYEYTEEPDGIVFIEWSDKFPEELPEDYIAIRFDRTEGAADERQITFRAVGEEFEEDVKELDAFCKC